MRAQIGISCGVDRFPGVFGKLSQITLDGDEAQLGLGPIPGPPADQFRKARIWIE
jgi:hypothetical protein